MDLRWPLLGLVAFALFVKLTRSKDRPASPNNKNNKDLSKPQFGASSSSSSSSSSPSSSSSTHSFTHDVFLSFRGPDTRNNFTGHLYRNLVQEGITTFIDNDLTRGEDITKELLNVIEGSRISIVVFSAKYASSKWCLEELGKIFQCKKSKQQIVYPVFYKVDPSDIRHQKGQVGDAIAHLSKHKDNLKKVKSWKAALTQAATLYGWHILDGGHEANFIDAIVKEISTKIMRFNPLDVAPYPVGLESRVEDILKLLNVREHNPHMIGIWGIGGIGKTTLAKAVYNSISNEFEHSCFLANVREESFSHEGLVKLQNNLLSKIIERDPPKVNNVDEGIIVLKQKLSQKRVLLILDDVDHLNQLKKLAGGCDWFGPRSRTIITTRDMNCLRAHKVNSIYEVKELNDQAALALFNFNAFKGNKRMDDFFELATEVICYAKGVPLVLEILGSDLCSKNKAEWKDALEYYSRYPNQEIQQTLKRSYESLEDRMKEVFLHIACFFKGYKESYVIDVLQSCDLNPVYSLKVLMEKALIKIAKDNSIWMHDLLEDMGKEIVRQESPNETGQRSRLWLYEDVCEVLEKNTGTDRIKGIVLRGVYSRKIRLNGRSFANLKNLQIFIVDHGRPCGDGMDYLPNQLRVLDWDDCSLRLDMLHMRMSGPWVLDWNDCSLQLGIRRGDGVDYIPNQLRAFDWNDCSLQLDIRRMSMGGPYKTPLIKGFKNIGYFKSIKLSRCDGLTTIPDFSGLTSLEYLELFYCRDLVEVHPSVGVLRKLVNLELTHCEKLQIFQERINLKSLETLHLSRCYQLKFFPEIEGDMKSLNRLHLRYTDIKELPCSIGNLTGLKSLSLNSCHNLTDIPSSIFYGLQRLEDLDLRLCPKLVTFPTKSESLPPPVFSTNLTRLQVHLDHCWRLEEISEFPREIDGLYVTDCLSLQRISKLSKILEGKDSKMFGRLDLTDCRTLCNNLARGIDGTKELRREAEKLTSLLTHFFSCPKSEEFHVEFYASAHIPIPNWFTCHHWHVNSEVIHKEHEFYIEIPQNSNWDNKGLALCIQSSSVDDAHFVYINGIKFDEKIMYGDKVWVHYIPLVTVIRRLSECGKPPPDMFRVTFRGRVYRGSWGVHLIEDLDGEGR